jgi:hypothetical protein
MAPLWPRPTLELDSKGGYIKMALLYKYKRIDK